MPADQRQLDPQHPVLIARADAVGVDVGAELDEPPEGATLDLDLLIPVGWGLGRAAAAGEEQLAALDLEGDVVGSIPAISAVTIARGGSDA